MLSMGTQYQPYTVIPTLLGADLGVLSHLLSQNDVIMSWLRLTATWNCFSHPYMMCTKCLSTLICCSLAYSSSLTQFYPPDLAQILGFWGSLVESKWCDYVMIEADSHLKPSSSIHIIHVQSVWAYWYAVHRHMVSAYHIYTQPTWFRFWGLGHLWSQNDVIMSWLMLTATSNCFPNLY